MTRGTDPDDPVVDPVPEPPGPAAAAGLDGEPTVVPAPPTEPASADEAPAARTLAGMLAARRARVSLPSVSLPISFPQVSLPQVSLPAVRVPALGRRAPQPQDAPATGGAGTAAADVPEPPDPPDLLVALEDALEEAVALDPVEPGAEVVPGGEEHAGGTDDLLAGWVARVIEAYPRPSYPMTQEWDVSIQGIVRLVPFLPRFATAPLALLDRFGAVTIGPERVGLDGKDVAWDRVVEVRTEPAWTRLSAEALEADLAQFVTVIPPVPGRGWVLRRISELLLSLYLAVLPPDDGDIDLDDPEDELLTSRVVTAVRYRRRFGHGEATVGAASTLLQLALPGTVETVVATAQEHDVPVRHVATADTDIGTVVRRAATWRRTAVGMRDDLAARWRR
ncbi:hypothetical protein Cfla_3545 [Cellulomonas flavigena DSM 20109]|uniref:Uncharacterized protein n=1 Tax=Cellulomonas flavigena (strain ATCC 482 / DSM 20109 / BCRC 11376 / JCM 18109 / NBRC 3775 / NCIMB 8073 / NRS 134) TaxID=446466 RepID=D5UDG1_CELFN|nr:hypothetical protein [Cellulomonas flavigena]ADG76417.1 hypothetical protein Cfla_3545 [Cellulomonas flavigena DSM 20109]